MQHQKPATQDPLTGLPGYLVDREFSDVDDLGEVAQGWGVDFRQLNRGGFKGRLQQAGFAGVQLGRVRLDGVIHQRGVSPGGFFSFAVPIQNDIDLLWRDHRVRPSEMLVYQSAGEIECTSKRDFEVLILAISEMALESAFERAGIAVDRRWLKSLDVLPVSKTAIDTLWAWIGSNLQSVVANPESIRRPAALQTLKNDGAGLLVDCLRMSRLGSTYSRSTRRRRLVEEAVKIARNDARRVHTVAELSRLSGASERTLRRGFHERFQTSPKAYLKAQRLIGVRRGIRATSAEVPISDIANERGFWHLGQFAADYRRHFGELPSETARARA